MPRKLFIFSLIISACFGAVWVADHPGTVNIQWLDYEIKASASALILTVFFAASLLWLIFSFLKSLFKLPAEIKQSRRLLQYQEGVNALTDAFVALSEQQHKDASNAIKKAEKLLPDPTLAHLMQLQLSRQDGNDALLQKQFKKLEESPKTKPLALRGLLEDARQNGHLDKALAYAEALVKMKPKQRTGNIALISLYSHHHRWQEALRAVSNARFRQVITSAEANHLKATIYLEHARKLSEEKNRQSSIEMLRKAIGHNPALTPASTRLATLMKQQGKVSAASRILRSAWKHAPHPSLYESYQSIYEDLMVEKRLKKVQELVKPVPDAIESQLALARALIEAGKYADARNQLKIALSKQETVSVCKLMAELEKQEHPEDPDKAQEWLERAAGAIEDAAWICTSCHHKTPKWVAHCPECNRFDTIEWKRRPVVYAQLNAA